VGGIYSPARIDDAGIKTSIEAADAYSDERRPLATVVPDPANATVGQYRFDDAGLVWALEKIVTALDSPIDCVVIDEIGPLELGQNKGYAPALERLETAKASSALIVVRAELLTRLQERLRELQPVTITLTRTNRDQLAARILDEMWASVAQRWQEN
jgi:nucleoside-triphosphatase THEP1